MNRNNSALWLASALSLALSIAAGVSGWQRGGNTLESSLWAMLSILAVLVVHLLPALLYQRGWLTLAAFPVWLGVFGVVAFSHAQFFTLAEIHAGQERLLKTPVTPLNDPKLMQPPTAPGRTAAIVARELSKAATLLSRLPETKRPAQQQAVDALRLELAAVQQAEASAAASLTRQQASIETRQADPVGLRLGQVLGLPVGNVMLVVALATALVLELACVVLWRLALVPSIPSPRTGCSNWWDRRHGWRWWSEKVQQAAALPPEPAAAGPESVPDSEPVSLATLASSNDAAAILALLKSRGALTAGMLQASVSRRIRPTLADLLAALEQAGQIKITAQGRGRVVELV
jgi:hypothetical protein